MISYRILVLGSDGRYLRAHQVECDDDAHAVRCVGSVVSGHDVEIWKFGRCIARLPSDKAMLPRKAGVEVDQ
jgi:hypothetical protein